MLQILVIVAVGDKYKALDMKGKLIIWADSKAIFKIIVLIMVGILTEIHMVLGTAINHKVLTLLATMPAMISRTTQDMILMYKVILLFSKICIVITEINSKGFMKVVIRLLMQMLRCSTSNNSSSIIKIQVMVNIKMQNKQLLLIISNTMEIRVLIAKTITIRMQLITINSHKPIMVKVTNQNLLKIRPQVINRRTTTTISSTIHNTTMLEHKVQVNNNSHHSNTRVSNQQVMDQPNRRRVLSKISKLEMTTSCEDLRNINPNVCSLSVRLPGCKKETSK